MAPTTSPRTSLALPALFPVVTDPPEAIALPVFARRASDRPASLSPAERRARKAARHRRRAACRANRAH